MKIYSLFITLFCCFLFQKATCSSSLSREQCIAIALDQNPIGRAAEEGVVAAQENILAARAPYFPNLNFLASYNRFQTHLFFPPVPSPIPGVTISVPSILGPFNDWKFRLSSHYTLYDSGYRKAQLEGAKSQFGEALQEQARTQQEIVLNVSLGFYRLLSELELQEVAVKSLERSNEHVKFARDRYNAGSVPYSDLLRAQVNTSHARQGKVKSESSIRIAQGNLNSYMGLPPQTRFEIIGEKETFQSPSEINIDNAIQKAEENRPEVQAALHRLQGLWQKRRQLQAAYGPKVVAQGYFGRCDADLFPQDPDWSVGVGLEIPLFEGFETRHQIKEVEALWRKQLAEYEQLVIEVKKNTWDAYSGLIEAYESIQTMDAQVKDAEESLRLISERYKTGAAIITDLLDAETAFESNQADLVNAKWNYRAAYQLFLWAQGK